MFGICSSSQKVDSTYEGKINDFIFRYKTGVILSKAGVHIN
jgi:hypothetical protein